MNRVSDFLTESNSAPGPPFAQRRSPSEGGNMLPGGKGNFLSHGSSPAGVFTLLCLPLGCPSFSLLNCSSLFQRQLVPRWVIAASWTVSLGTVKDKPSTLMGLSDGDARSIQPEPRMADLQCILNRGMVTRKRKGLYKWM